MRARCYPFNLPKNRFHSFNPQVGCALNNFNTIPGTYSVHTSTYWVHTEYVLSTCHEWCCCAALVQDTVLVVPPASKASGKRRKETCDGSKDDGAWNEVWVGLVWVCTHTDIVRTFYLRYVPSTYYFPRVCTRHLLVCTVFTKILQLILFCVVCLWETILCVRDMYAVVLQYWFVPLLLSNRDIQDIIFIWNLAKLRYRSKIPDIDIWMQWTVSNTKPSISKVSHRQCFSFNIGNDM